MTGRALQICSELTNFTILQTFKERTVFKLVNMGFAKEDTHTFTGTGSNGMTESQTR